MPIVDADINSITTDSGSPNDFITNDQTLIVHGDALLSVVGTTLGVWLVGGAFATPTLVGTVALPLVGVATPWSFDFTTSANVNAQVLAPGTYTIIVADNLLPF